MPSPIEDIMEEARDPEFAKEYGEELAKISMAVTMANARKEKGLSQEELAEMTGTSQPYIAKLESGYANPSIGAVAKILAVMGFRLVPGKDSLVPEAKPSYQGMYICELASEEVDFGIPPTTPNLFLASGLNTNPDPGVLWQNPDLPRNSRFQPFAFGTANNENPILASTNREA